MKAIGIAAGTACLLLGLVATASAQMSARSEGPNMYRQYCATCHGLDAKGNGPTASSLKKAPADLTVLQAAGQKVPDSKPIMEINPGHPLVQRLKYEESHFADWSQVLFDQALLAEGGQLEDPAGFVKRLNELMLAMAGGGSKIWTPGG